MHSHYLGQNPCHLRYIHRHRNGQRACQKKTGCDTRIRTLCEETNLKKKRKKSEVAKENLRFVFFSSEVYRGDPQIY